MRRLCDVGIVRVARPGIEGHAAAYELDPRHPLIPGLIELFAAEYDIVRVELRPCPNRRLKGADATSRRPNPSQWTCGPIVRQSSNGEEQGRG
jgi:hypothetical protein